MAKTEPFDKYLNDYEEWFYQHRYVYESELKAVSYFIPEGKKGVEIGTGSGRFSIPFGIKDGVEPSRMMRRFAGFLGLNMINGTAEDIPLPDESYDFVLMVTTICFVDDPRLAFREVNRILKPGGIFIVGLVDKASPLGRTYQQIKNENKFYCEATFYSTIEVLEMLDENGFTGTEIIQTVFGNLEDIKNVQMFKPGYGEGGFVVIKSSRKASPK